MRLLLAVLLALGAGCATSGAASAPATPAASDQPLGVEEMQPGTGDEAVAGKQVTVAYTGWLADGRRFASSAKDGKPLTFTLGKGQVIRGLEEGVQGMKVGGKRRLVIPPRLAYGLPRGIPEDATVVYEVELLEVR